MPLDKTATKAQVAVWLRLSGVPHFSEGLNIAMSWGVSRLSDLTDLVAKAGNHIGELFRNAAVPLKNAPGYGWGQFFNDPSQQDQYGVFGTCAGVQVLARDQDPRVRGAVKWLEAQLNTSELDVLYKLADVADALWLGADVNSGEEPMKLLIKRQLQTGGWSEHVSSDTPRLLATATALLTLSRYEAFRESPECQKALRWLYGKAGADCRPFEWALMAMAIVAYADEVPQGDAAAYEDAKAHCVKELTRWAKARERQLGACKFYALADTYHYNVDHRRYLTFLSDCLVALALMKLASPKATRRYILKTVRFYAERVLKERGLRCLTTDLASTIHHLWLFRLFEEFRGRPAKELRPASRAWVKLLIVAVLGLTAAFACYHYSSTTVDPWSRDILAVVVMILTSWLADYVLTRVIR